MPATTKNRKILDKEFLEDSIYLYDKNYTHKKQNIIDNKSPHISLESKDEKDLSKAKLNINISNDSERKNYDYLIANNDEKNNTLKWISPVYPDDKELLSTEKLNEYDKKLISAKALNNFQGTENINTVGEITSGTWNAGSITAAGNIKATGTIRAKKAEIAGFATESTQTDNLTAINVKTEGLNVIGNADIAGDLVAGKVISTSFVIGENGEFGTGKTNDLEVINSINAIKIDDENGKADYKFKLNQTSLGINSSNINLTGATTIKNGNSAIELNGSKTDINSSNINLTGATTIKNNDKINIEVNANGTTISGNTSINNILTIDNNKVSVTKNFEILDKDNINILNINSKEVSVYNSINSIKLGNYFNINTKNVTVGLPLILERGTIKVGENVYEFADTEIILGNDFDFDFQKSQS